MQVRRVHLLLGALAGVGALVLLSPDATDTDRLSSASVRAGAAGGASAKPLAGDRLLMVAARVAAYDAGEPSVHVDLFSDRSKAASVAQALPAAPAAASAPLTPVAPLPPSLPFTVFGKKLEAGAWEVYLVEGDNTLVARVGERLDSVYSVDSISPPIMTLTYLPLRTVQSVQIGDMP